MSKPVGLALRTSLLVAAVLGLAVVSHPSSARVQPSLVVPPQLLSVMAAYGADTVTLDRAARDFKFPDEIPWRGRGGPGGSQSAILFGDPSKPGLYVQLLKRGSNNWARPHSHPNDRFITVLEGTFWIGTGSNYDQNNVVALKPGSFVRDIANQMHYDGTKEDGATIEIVGMGPVTSNAARAK